MKGSFLRKTGFVLMMAGLLIFLFPDLHTVYLDVRTEAEIKSFEEETAETEAAAAEADDPALQLLANYNQRIFEENQPEFISTQNTETVPDPLSSWEDRMFGYIEIPAMDLRLPLYIGASSENLAAGAAILGGTSVPIGGAGTNSVIAGHRGYRGSPYFREIEKLQCGDSVYITNSWGTLTYRVDGISVIDPSDTGALRIREGEDRITLITCHPYRSHGKYRYVVSCVRAEDQDDTAHPENMKTTENEENTEHTEYTETTEFPAGQGEDESCAQIAESSAADITAERIVRSVFALFLAALVSGSVLRKRMK